MDDTSEIKRATAKAIKADYVRHTITVTLEANLSDFESVERDTLALWAESGQTFRVECYRKTRPEPLLELTRSGSGGEF